MKNDDDEDDDDSVFSQEPVERAEEEESDEEEDFDSDVDEEDEDDFDGDEELQEEGWTGMRWKKKLQEKTGRSDAWATWTPMKVESPAVKNRRVGIDAGRFVVSVLKMLKLFIYDAY